MLGLGHVLVPLDGSQLAEAAIDEARRIITSGGDISLLIAVQVPNVPVYGYELSSNIVPAYQSSLDEAYAGAQEYLERVANELRTEGFHVRVIVQFGDDAASVIVRSAQQYAADAIVMSTHGRSGVSRWLFGSVTNKVLQSTTCPVMVVPSRIILEHKDAVESSNMSVG
jgi:nucleotide-binding universal stress UspA family protein